MRKISSNLIKYTQDIWEPRLGYRPTEGECEEMIRNVTGLFRLLMEWEFDREPDPGPERERESKDSCSSDNIVDHCSLSNGDYNNKNPQHGVSSCCSSNGASEEDLGRL